MSIMEKNLPVAESLNEGDMVRIITEEGNSKQIDVSKINSSGQVLIVTAYDSNEGTTVLDKTWQDIYDVYTNGIVLLRIDSESGTSRFLSLIIAVGYDVVPGERSDYRVVDKDDRNWICNSPNEYPFIVWD